MKKIIYMILAVSLCLSVLVGCSAGKTDIGATEGASNSPEKKISIVTTIFAPYDFVRQITLNTSTDLTMLIKPGAEVHSYEPTSQDIIKIQNCDLFVYVGGENDAWVENILSSLDKSVKTLRLVNCVSLYEEEAKEGMQAEEESGDGGEEAEWDEHVWTSPKNAIDIVSKITDELCSIDSPNADAYRTNSKKYILDLNDLDQKFKDVVDNAKRKALVFADRFPARYFVEEFGVDYFAAFPGCSTDTEASAATVAFLIDKVKSENIPAVFYIELSNQKLADTICEATGAKKLLFHCCHNVSKEDFDAGQTYLSLMTENVETLKEALN